MNHKNSTPDSPGDKRILKTHLTVNELHGGYADTVKLDDRFQRILADAEYVHLADVA